MPEMLTTPTGTAAEAPLRRVVIEPVSRVEGHGKVTLLLDEDNHVRQARLHIVEFRGFEKFVQGRPFWEVPVLVQRLCGICPVSHHLAASKAMDMIVGATELTPTADRMRRLLHYGQILQSHALHFFHLCSPDLLFGFDAEPERRNIFAVAAAHPELAKKGVLLRKYGQEVIRVTSGKRIHGSCAVPGGVNKHLSPEERDYLLADIERTIAWSQEAVEIVKRLYTDNKDRYNAFGRFASSFVSLVDADGALDFYHGGLRARNERGGVIFDHVDYASYWDVIFEETRTWSYMKFPYLRALGPGGRLVPRRAARPRQQLRRDPDAACGSRAGRVQELRRRQRDAGEPRLPLGADDRDAARGRGPARAPARPGAARRRARRPRYARAAWRRRDRGAARAR